MSVFNYIIEKLKSGIITFVNMVTLANRDYPYHDYARFVQEEETPALNWGYAVGTNNIKANGSQHKLFTSKSTLMMCTNGAHIVLNNTNNNPIFLVANTWYEFKSNIYMVYILGLGDNSTIYLYFEGVLPEEQRTSQ